MGEGSCPLASASLDVRLLARVTAAGAEFRTCDVCTTCDRFRLAT